MILVANAASAAAVYYASIMPMLVKRNVPIRFGAIFYTDKVLQVNRTALKPTTQNQHPQHSPLILSKRSHNCHQASQSLDNSLADPPYNIINNDDVATSSASGSDYVDQSTAFALAFACLKQR
jgi:hypothetical protein